MNKTKTEKRAFRIILTILLGCAAVFLYYYAITRIQLSNMIDQTQAEMKENVLYLEDAYPKELQIYQDMVMSMEELYDENLMLLREFSLGDPDFEISDSWLVKNLEKLCVADVAVADRQGNVLASAAGEIKDLTGEDYEPIRDTFETGTMCSLRRVGPEAEEQYMLYALASDEEHEFVLKAYNTLLDSDSMRTTAWGSILDNETIGQQGFAFVWSDENGKLLYYPSDDEDGRTPYYLANEWQGVEVEKLGIRQDQVRDGAFKWFKINGTRMYVHTSYFEEEGVWIACAVSGDELENSTRFVRIVLSALFALFCAAIVHYVILLLKQKRVKVLSDFTGSGKNTGHKSKQYKLMILTILLTIVMFSFHFFLLTMHLMSTWAQTASRRTERIEDMISSREEFAKTYIDYLQERKTQQLELLARYLADNPEQCTTLTLDELSFAVKAFEIQVQGKRGSVKASTSSTAYPSMLDDDPGGSETSAESVQEDGQEENSSVFKWMSEGRSVILPLTGSSGVSTGLLYVRYYSSLVDQMLENFSREETLKRIQPGKGGFVFSVDIDTKKFSFYPADEMTGRDALGYGLTENQIKDNYCDYISINGVSYYAVTDMIGTDLIYYVVPENRLLGRRLPICLQSMIVAMGLFFVIGLGLYTSREQVEYVQPDEERHTLQEDRNSPEYRTLRLLLYYTVGAAALYAAYSAFRANTQSGGVIGYMLDGRWEKGLNVFALSSAVLIMSQGGIILFLFSKMVKLVGNILPIRGGTILKMIGSLITYVVMGFLIYRCMVCFGMNPTALMASAGIVSVVVGIGANNLVGDILAGIFLLMEGNVQVGDVIQIQDFRGYVMELGIRMTKVFDMDTDNVKIIPNNEVRNVVHMTMRASIVYSDFMIRYEEKLEDVERILCEELKKAQKSSLILSGPVYIGVNGLDESGVVLRTATRCHESSRRKVEREVNHIVYSIFQKNQISVPYPQVTLHEGDDNMVER